MRYQELPPRLPTSPQFSRLWEGEVTSIAAGRPKVKIPMLSGHSVQYGPCRVVEGPWTAGELATITDGGSYLPVPHTHAVVVPLALAVGNAVLVGFIGGNRSRPIVLARIAI